MSLRAKTSRSPSQIEHAMGLQQDLWTPQPLFNRSKNNHLKTITYKYPLSTIISP
jgi:hypothetical protein